MPPWWHVPSGILFLFLFVPTAFAQLAVPCNPAQASVQIYNCSNNASCPMYVVGWQFIISDTRAAGNCTMVVYSQPGTMLVSNIRSQSNPFPATPNANLAFYDGNSTRAPSLGRVYYFQQFPVWVTTSGPVLTVVYNTDGFDFDHGYIGLQTDAVNPLTHPRGPFPPYKPCAAWQNITLPNPGVTGVSQTSFSEPMYPYYAQTDLPWSSYSPHNCSWRLTAPPGTTIQGVISGIDQMLMGDRAIVYDTDATVNGMPVGNVLTMATGYGGGYSDTQAMNPAFVSTGNTLIVSMVVRPGSKLGARGFLVSLEVTRCSVVNRINVTSNATAFTNLFNVGTTYMPSPPNGCSWLFVAPPGQMVQISAAGNQNLFAHDAVVFFDGVDANGGRFQPDGFNMYNVISSGNQIFARMDPNIDTSYAYYDRDPQLTVYSITLWPRTNFTAFGRDVDGRPAIVLFPPYIGTVYQPANGAYVPLAPGLGVNSTLSLIASPGKSMMIGTLNPFVFDIWLTDSATKQRTHWYTPGTSCPYQTTYSGVCEYVSTGRNLTVEFIYPPGTMFEAYFLYYAEVTNNSSPCNSTFQVFSTPPNYYGYFSYPQSVLFPQFNSNVFVPLPRGRNCTWTLRTADPRQILGISNTLYLGNTFPDTFSVYDGPNTSSPLIFQQVGGFNQYSYFAFSSNSTLTISLNTSSPPMPRPTAAENLDILSSRHLLLFASQMSYFFLYPPCHGLHVMTGYDEPYIGSPVAARDTACAFIGSAANMTAGACRAFSLQCSTQAVLLQVSNITFRTGLSASSPVFFNTSTLDTYCRRFLPVVDSNPYDVTRITIILPLGEVFINFTTLPNPGSLGGPFSLYPIDSSGVCNGSSAVLLTATSGFLSLATTVETIKLVTIHAYWPGQMCQTVYTIAGNGSIEISVELLDIAPGGWVALLDETGATAANCTGVNFTPNATTVLLFGSFTVLFHAPTGGDTRTGLGFVLRFNVFPEFCPTGSIVLDNYVGTDGENNVYQPLVTIPGTPPFQYTPTPRVRPGATCSLVFLAGNYVYMDIKVLTPIDIAFYDFRNVFIGDLSSLSFPVALLGPLTLNLTAGPMGGAITLLTVRFFFSDSYPTPVIPQCAGRQNVFLADDLTPFCVEIGQSDQFNDPDANVPIFYPPNLDCSWNFILPPGYALTLDIHACLWAHEDYLEIYQNGVLLRQLSGGSLLQHIVGAGGDIEVRFTTSNRTDGQELERDYPFKLTAIYTAANVYQSWQLTQTMGETERLFFGIPLHSGVFVGPQLCAADLANTYVDMSDSSIVLPDNIGTTNLIFPNLISISTYLNIYGQGTNSPSDSPPNVELQALSFPKLRYARTLRVGGADAQTSFTPRRPTGSHSETHSGRFQVRSAFPPITVQLPQLIAVAQLHAYNFLNVIDWDFSSLQHTEEICFFNVPSLQSVDISALRHSHMERFAVINAPSLVSLSFGLGTSVHFLFFQYIPVINTTAFSALSSVQQMTLDFYAGKTLDLDDVPFTTGAYVEVGSNSYLTTFHLNMTRYQYRNFQLVLNSNFILATIDIPGFNNAYINIDQSHASSLDFSSAFRANLISLATNYYLTNLSVPNLQRIDDTISLEITRVLTTLSFPKLGYTYNFRIGKASALAEIHACNIRLGTASIGGPIPKLSCNDTFALFGSVLSYSDVVGAGCDATTIGTFGCARGETTIVSCNYAVSCIQDAIDRTISGGGNLVQVLPGTYTGCGTGINLMGKSIEVYGAGMGVSIIDCQGAGRGLFIGTGEGPDTILRDITFRNGTADVGGLGYISSASPTLERVTFEYGVATSAGGGVAVVSNSAPTFIDCVFRDNQAGSGGGGALYTDSSVPYINGGTFLDNVATGDGGALLLAGEISPNAPIAITGTVFVGNKGLRGGAIFTEPGLTLTNVTMASNTASRFGGGFMAVPLNDLGVAYLMTGGNVSANVAGTGGGIFVYSGNLDIVGTTVSGNVATGTSGGGGIYTICSQNYRILFDVNTPCELIVSIRNATLSGNFASRGNGGGALIREMMLTMTHVTISGNSAAAGAGAYLTASSSYIESSVFTSNQAATGGGLYCEPFTGTCSVATTTFANNIVSVAGAGAYLCTVACPSSTPSLDRLDHVPDWRSQGRNSFSGNRIPATGYGVDVGSDAAQLRFSVPPLSTVISGRALVTPPSLLTIVILDAFGQTVTATADNTVLTLSLDASRSDGTNAESDTEEDTAAVTVGGQQTVLATAGSAVFTDATLVVTGLADLGQEYTLTARLSEIDTVSISVNVTVAACSPGQGRLSADDVISCDDCTAGTFADSSTVYVCTACPAGSFTPATASTACTLCAQNTFAPSTGSTACQACPDGYESPAGAIACSQSAAIGGLSSGTVGGVVGGVIVAVIVLIIIIALVLYRFARRRTMQKYYLDNDATVRTGTQETPLQKEVKRILLASSTTRIGGGLYSNVYKAKYEESWIALKVIKGEMATNGTAQQEFRREAVALSRLEERQHPGIIGLRFFLNFNPMCIGVAFCNGGALKQALANGIFPSMADKIRLAAEAASAFTAIHAANIVHLDIKTDNMLLSADNHVIVADFGIARVIYESEPGLPNEYVHGSSHGNLGSQGTGSVTQFYSAGLGSAANQNSLSSGVQIITHSEAFDTAFTPQYVDPLRIISDMNHDEAYLKCADLFSFGIMMWAIVSGKEPYAGEPPAELVDRLREFPLTRPPPLSDAPPAYTTWMNRCWHTDPRQRPTFAEVFEGLAGLLREAGGGDLSAGYARASAAGKSV